MSRSVNHDGPIQLKGLVRTWHDTLVFRVFLAFVVFIFFLPFCKAQSPTFEHLTVGDGLSHNSVYDIIQDRAGFFWIGTRHGLNRYDGYDFQVFMPGAEEGAIGALQVLSLLEDSRGRIWAGHREGGISIYDKQTGKFTPFSLGPGGDTPVDWSTITVRTLFEDSKERIWIGTFGGGVTVLNKDGSLAYHFSTYTDSAIQGRLSNDFVFDFAEDAGGNIYVATSGRGLNYIDFTRQEIVILHSSDEKDLDSFDKTLCLSAGGDLWIGTSGNGLYNYKPAQNSWQHFSAPEAISHPIVTDLAIGENGHIWLTTDGGGLNVLDPATGQWDHHAYDPKRSSSLNTNALYHLFFDRSGNLWVGSFNGGLNVYRTIQPPFVTNRRYDEERSQGLRSVLAVAQGGQGSVYLGTDGGGMFTCQDTSTNERQTTTLNFQPAFKGRRPGSGIDDVITSLAPSNELGLWYGSYAAGLGYVNYSTGEVTKFRHREDQPGSLAHDNVWDVALAPDGGVWVGTLGGGLDYLAPGATTFEHFVPGVNDQQSLSGRLVVDVLLDLNGKYLWVATETSGLNRLDLATREVKQYRHDPNDANSISSDKLRHLFQDEDGSIWVGTEYDGLNHLQPGQENFRRFGKSNGYPFGMVNGMVKDQEGNYWISGLKNIYRWNMADAEILKIGEEEELGYNLYNPGAIARLDNGLVIIGGVNGFSAINPANVKSLSSTPKVLLTEMQLANASITPGLRGGREILTGDLNDANTQVQLSYRDRGIAFHFATPGYPAPNQVRYAYRLNGFDRKWNYTTAEEHLAYYSNLKGGTYQFEVKAAGADGKWGPATPSLKVIVSPPFWRTTWFYTAAVLLVILLIYGLNRFLLKQQKERYQQQVLAKEKEILSLKNESLKEEVVRKRSELGASMLQMAHKNKFLNDLKNKIKQLKEKEEATPAKSLRSVIRVIDGELAQEDYREQFRLIFDQSYKDFVIRMRQVHPKLSANDSRLCCFIRMELTNREIASILNITLNGVEQAKYRLKKKMALEKEVNLNEYIREFN